MYLEYYGLEQAPFSITPDPHYVFLSEHHRDALAHLLYGIRQGGGGGFVQLTGEVGTGKTTLSRLLLNQLPENTHAALVLNPRLEPAELLQTICEELRLPVGGKASAPAVAPGTAKRKPRAVASKPPGGKAMFDALSAYLLEAYAKGDKVVLIIDEAQNLSTEALEQVRLLTNLETETQKLLQIILIGQPELRETLARPELRQLAQRITARYHLRPLDEAGTAAYLRHRLNTAGADRFPFSADAVRRVYQRSGGVPRLINVIAERALLGGYAHDLLTIDAKTVDRAANEALAPSAHAETERDRKPLLIAAALIVGVAAIAFALSGTAPTDTSVSDAAIASPAQVETPAAQPPTLDGDALLQRVRASSPTSPHEWQALVAAWKAPAAVRAIAPDACPPLPAPGWRCLRSRASLDQLLRFDRPVLLRLRAEPKAVWASLLGADAASARISLDGTKLEIDRVALAAVWNGEYLALWNAPDALEIGFAAGDAAALEWVRQRLRTANLDTPGTDASAVDRTDPSIALRAFQARHGLRSDAILGPETLFVLSSDATGPHLSAAGE
ncbi:MAG: AAA family ATPase [Lysobacter sp.]|nr:AAA family ATPase [Lysobacter sp.]